MNSPSSFFAEGDWRALFPRFSGENYEENVKLVEAFKGLAEKECTAAQLAIAWLLKQGEDIIPIPGTKKVRYLEENWEALGVEISDGEEREVRVLVEGSVRGERTFGLALEQCFADTREWR